MRKNHSSQPALIRVKHCRQLPTDIHPSLAQSPLETPQAELLATRDLNCTYPMFTRCTLYILTAIYATAFRPAEQAHANGRRRAGPRPCLLINTPKSVTNTTPETSPPPSSAGPPAHGPSPTPSPPPYLATLPFLAHCDSFSETIWVRYEVRTSGR